MWGQHAADDTSRNQISRGAVALPARLPAWDDDAGCTGCGRAGMRGRLALGIDVRIRGGLRGARGWPRCTLAGAGACGADAAELARL